MYCIFRITLSIEWWLVIDESRILNLAPVLLFISLEEFYECIFGAIFIDFWL